MPHHFVCVETFTLPYLTKRTRPGPSSHPSSSIAEGELGLLATRRLEKFEVCSIYTGEIFRTGTAQPPETVPDELSRHTAAGGTQLDESDDESGDDFDSVEARGPGRTLRSRCNFDWPAASNEPKRGTRATHFVRLSLIHISEPTRRTPARMPSSA